MLLTDRFVIVFHHFITKNTKLIIIWFIFLLNKGAMIRGLKGEIGDAGFDGNLCWFLFALNVNDNSAKELCKSLALYQFVAKSWYQNLLMHNAYFNVFYFDLI